MADVYSVVRTNGGRWAILSTVCLLGSGCAGEAVDQEPPASEANGSLHFTAVQPDLFGAPGGQPNAWADFDGDGDLDLFVGFRGGADRLYRNDEGTFVDVAPEVGIAFEGETRAAAWGDFDADGDLDLYVGFPASDENPDRLYRNSGSGSDFVDVAGEFGIDVRGTTRQPSWIDYDGDGDLDLSVALRDGPNRLYRNDGSAFVEVGEAVGMADPRRTVSAAWFDMDADGDLDVFTANQNGDEDGFYRNDGGHFVDVAASLGMHQPGRASDLGSVGTAVTDYDNDGDLDLFVASYGPDILWQNEGDGTFTRVSEGHAFEADHHSVAAAWGDADNSGRPDLYVGVFVSGEPEARDQLALQREGGFLDVTPSIMARNGASHGVAWADYDLDGDLDLALANNAPDVGRHPLYRNEQEGGDRSLQVAVTDLTDRWLYPGGEVRLYDSETGALLGSRLVDTGGGYSSQGAAPLHFGLPEGVSQVDVESTVLRGGERLTEVLEGVSVRRYRGRVLRIGR